MASDPALLRVATDTAHATAFALFGIRNTCIATAAGLHDGLVQCGLPDVALVRVEATGHGPTVAAVLGCQQRSRFEQRSGTGWAGHLVVMAGTDPAYLLDPTVTQLNQGDDWTVLPTVAAVPCGAFEPVAPYRYCRGFSVVSAEGATRIHYRKAAQQSGWKSTAAFRPTQGRREIAAAVRVAVEVARRRLFTSDGDTAGATR